MKTVGITSGDLLRALDSREIYIRYSELLYDMQQLGIKFKSRVVAGFEICAYLTWADVRKLLDLWGINLQQIDYDMAQKRYL